jgi:hypothetical protein
MLKLTSAAQVHPVSLALRRFAPPSFLPLMRIPSNDHVQVIATRWAGHLKSAKLEIVMAANDGYLPGMVNFSCRVARCAINRAAGHVPGAPRAIKGKKATAGARKEQTQVFDVFKRVAPTLEQADELTATATSIPTGEPPTSADEGVTGEISIPAILIAYASRVPGLREEMGEDFARGHAQASGGIVTKQAFERLWESMSHVPEGESSLRKGKAGKDKDQTGAMERWLKKKT